jgi:gluconolactonase
MLLTDGFVAGGGVLEGPVWIDGALYPSQFAYGPVPSSRILKLDANGTMTVFAPDAGTNGLAVDAQGDIVAGRHADGSISRIPLSAPDAPVPIASMYDSARFNSPNDLTLRSDGNIYFTDPTWQAPSQPPQTATRVYRVAPGGQVSSIDESLDQPNGITLSLDENTLYVADRQNIYRYDVDQAGAVSGKAQFVPGASDGMGIDCAGNLYATRDRTVLLFDPSGAPAGTLNVGSAGNVTNVAFGGPERRTLYITTLGDTQELWRAELAVPGMPY